MNKIKTILRLLIGVSTVIFLPIEVSAKCPCKACLASSVKKKENDIPPRMQWNENFGYCGEVSLISAGLYYGQYISQYTARAMASNNTPQNLLESQLMLGVNDQYAAAQMHLKSIVWNTDTEQNTPQFLAWVKQNVVNGYPVAIGIYTNEFLFYRNKNPNAGDKDFDHIVPVTGIESTHDLSDGSYYGDDVIHFSDNGLWGNSANPPFNFVYTFQAFQANRQQANAKNGPIYSLSNNASNYGIAITGVMDLDGDTLPVRLTTNVNDEKPEIQNGSNIPPASMPIILTITVSGLQPDVLYYLYRYNTLESVPDSHFNANADNAYESWQILIDSGSTYTMTEQINSDEIAVYRVVKATAL